MSASKKEKLWLAVVLSTSAVATIALVCYLAIVWQGNTSQMFTATKHAFQEEGTRGAARTLLMIDAPAGDTRDQVLTSRDGDAP